MIKLLIALVLPLYVLAQTEEVERLLTDQTWNIAYNISPEGERIDEESQEKIRANWVKFYADGTFEMPGGMSGKTVGKWSFNQQTNAIHFIENGTKYRAVIDELSDINLVLNYVDNGGFKIGLIHYIHIPKPKSNEEVKALLTAGKWNVVLRRFEEIEDRTPVGDTENTWYIFNEDGTYQKSEVVAETQISSDGFWFLDDKFQLNLDAGENTIYSVVGDKSKLILTTITGGYNTIEMRKATD